MFIIDELTREITRLAWTITMTQTRHTWQNVRTYKNGGMKSAVVQVGKGKLGFETYFNIAVFT